MNISLTNKFDHTRSRPRRKIHLIVSKHERNGTQIGNPKTITFNPPVPVPPFSIVDQQYLKITLDPKHETPDRGAFSIYFNKPNHKYFLKLKVLRVAIDGELKIEAKKASWWGATVKKKGNKWLLQLMFPGKNKNTSRGNVTIGDGNQ